MKIVCVGGGPAGLFLSVLLKRAEPTHDVTVLERNAAGVTQGWGVVFWDDLLAAMEAHDPETTRLVAAAAYQWHGVEVNVDGRPVWAPEATGFSIARQKLIALLAAEAEALGVRVEYNCETDSAVPMPGVDLVVAADGVGSRFRRTNAQALGSTVTPSQNKYVWLGTTKVFDSFTFAFRQTEAGWVWCHAYGYDQDRSTFIVECHPDTWRGLGLDRLGVDASLEVLQDLFADQLDGHPLLVPTRQGATLPWLSFGTVHSEHWYQDNVALMGDAAHTTHFSIGSGTKLALEDAIGLAAALARNPDVATALGDYERDRKAAVRRAQQDARYSVRWFENVPRYLNLDPERFSELMDRRRSRALAHLPPVTYLRLRRLVDDLVPRRRRERRQRAA